MKDSCEYDPDNPERNQVRRIFGLLFFSETELLKKHIQDLQTEEEILTVFERVNPFIPRESMKGNLLTLLNARLKEINSDKILFVFGEKCFLAKPKPTAASQIHPCFS